MTYAHHDWSTGAVFSTSAATVTPLPTGGRLSLRVASRHMAAFVAATGIQLPARIGQRISDEGIDILCLGPDEWQIRATSEVAATLVRTCAAAYHNAPHSLVDITYREVAFRIQGPQSADLLMMGMVRNVADIVAGTGRRINFDGVTIVLRRDGETDFTLEIWNSFVPHVLHLLETGCRELAASASS